MSSTSVRSGGKRRRGPATDWPTPMASGLIRFSATETDRKREPRLVQASPALSEPRIYFGNFPQEAADAASVAPELRLDGGPADRGVTLGSGEHSSPRGRRRHVRERTDGVLPLQRDRRNQPVGLGPSGLHRVRAGQQGAASLRRHHARFAGPPAPRRARPAADTGPVHPVGLRCGAAHRERTDRLRRGRLHHEQRTIRTPSRSTWAAPGSATPARRCAPPSTRSRAGSTST